MGVNQYVQQAYMTDAFKEMYSPEKLSLIEATPAWATGAFAVAVFSATLGCLALLLRKKIAKTFFIVSLLGIIVQNIDGFMRFNFSEFETFEVVMTLMIPIIGIFLIWYSKNAIAKGWIK